MAKKKGQPQKEPEPEPVEEEEEEDDDDEEEEELELLQVDLGDVIKLKQILDETVAAAMLDHIEEDYYLDNIKLALMVAACSFAMVAQFAEKMFNVPFPESRFLLGGCCCCYFVLSGILQLITTFIDQDAILLTLPKSTSKNKDLKDHGIRVRTQFPRFSEFFTVVLEYQKKENSPHVEQTWSVGQFFDKEGFFDEIGLQLEVEKLFNRLEDGKYDSDKAAAAEKKNQ